MAGTTSPQPNYTTFDGEHALSPAAVAAYTGNREELEKLFKEGACPNAFYSNEISPLTAAILKGHLECVKIVLDHPEFDPTPTETLLNAFAQNGMQNGVSACCELAASAVFGCQFVSTAHEPLPRELTLRHILHAENWVLLMRFVEHNEIDKTDRRRIVEHMSWQTLEHYPMYGILVLAKLLAACPELLKHHAVQQCFVSLALRNPSGIAQELRPFVKMLPKKIILKEGSAFHWGGAGNLLSRWRLHLGTQTAPYLDLAWRLPDAEPSEDAVEHLLHICSITGKIPANDPSPLLIDIIAYASEDTLRTHLQPGGKLAPIGHKPVAQAAQSPLVSTERRTFIENLLREDNR